MKKFEIPSIYDSSILAKVKAKRAEKDPKKKDISPSLLDFGNVKFHIARHFGFCYGVENAIEISYKALKENPDKNIYLLSQMIHNPVVNHDLQERGIRFLMDTEGNQLIDWDVLSETDIVIIPAFGTTLENEKKLKEIGISVEKYNTTCPFVERVWKKSKKLADDQYSIIIHGKPSHEETKATFSHSQADAPSIVIKDMKEAKYLAQYILGEIALEDFWKYFEGRVSTDFNPEKDLLKVGVVNQTTMLASDTQSIADFIKQTMSEKYGEENIKNHFADTRDTLCYATNENQDATTALLEQNADLAIVVGGYNSSNTSHLVELLERKFPTYFISSADEILSKNEIQHFIYEEKKLVQTKNFLPSTNDVKIVITSGASCPDNVMDDVILKLLNFYPVGKSIDEVLNNL
jgi:4-hydroxy-3-methylbut-2-en-1-yl diphosphate reductase